jgi:hypothetical protein
VAVDAGRLDIRANDLPAAFVATVHRVVFVACCIDLFDPVIHGSIDIVGFVLLVIADLRLIGGSTDGDRMHEAKPKVIRPGAGLVNPLIWLSANIYG